VESQEWKDEIERSQLTAHYLQSHGTGEFLAAENDKLSAVMQKLGLAR
jgi:tripartite-type tricarboxylate transporter receptor subunit TctC